MKPGSAGIPAAVLSLAGETPALPESAHRFMVPLRVQKAKRGFPRTALSSSSSFLTSSLIQWPGVEHEDVQKDDLVLVVSGCAPANGSRLHFPSLQLLSRPACPIVLGAGHENLAAPLARAGQ